ncbi:hypothetical protein [Frankia sp. R82]|uniref:hypothetical protein n=1 Tax=Frankia sp. R82 TaxID=2950553 RepID=UPI002043361E|nr:hypothetical protein [Frankia sp. R82]MCM3885317.1 hypothetical protein [Frankia sp. R82]
MPDILVNPHARFPAAHGSKNDYRMGFAARYVPTQVQVYPDTETVAEYGGGIPLDHYGAVVVAGEDTYGGNRIARESRTGCPFRSRRRRVLV